VTCLFCGIVEGTQPAHIVLREPQVVGFLDVRPVFPGHVLVVPREHHVVLSELPEELLAPLFGAVRRVSAAVVEGLGAHGSFVANNNTVSQSVAHLHVHVVPRRRKDGLRGFFWPRQRYASDAEAEDYAGRLRAALEP
jgi:histidine triad (HIT) family protein